LLKSIDKAQNQELKKSFRKIGPLYPVLVDHYGNIIDGEHRSKVTDSWPRFTLENIKSEKERLIIRLITNNQRRKVPIAEKSRLLSHLAKIFVGEGTEKGHLGYEIAEATGMSYQWVMKYLPEQFKDELQSDRAKSAPHRRAINFKLREPPKGAITVLSYKNTEFVNIVVEKSIYEKLAEKASEWDVTPDKIIYNALLLMQNSNRP
jgi:ParB-like chromosome segregation protein Spo0J